MKAVLTGRALAIAVLTDLLVQQARQAAPVKANTKRTMRRGQLAALAVNAPAVQSN